MGAAIYLKEQRESRIIWKPNDYVWKIMVHFCFSNALPLNAGVNYLLNSKGNCFDSKEKWFYES